MDTINDLLYQFGYRIYSVTTDQRYYSFVQEEHYCLNVICLYDERRETSTRPQMQQFIAVQKQRLEYGRNKDIHFLNIVITNERGVGHIAPMPDESSINEGGRNEPDSWVDRVWYLIDDGYASSWRLFVPPAAMQDFYGIRGRMDEYVRQVGVTVELPEIVSDEAKETHEQVDRTPNLEPKVKISVRELPWMTFTLLMLNVIIYIFQVRGDIDSRLFAEEDGILSKPEEWYRLFTHMFFHGSASHLLSNLIGIYAAGTYLESKLGHVFFLILYVFGGLCGSIFSVVCHAASGDSYYSVGASGAVYALVGGMIAWELLRPQGVNRGTITRILIAVMIMVYSASVPDGSDRSTNHYAHIGGLVAGFIMVGIYCIIKFRKVRKKK